MRNLENNLNLCSINTATLGFKTDIFDTVDCIAKYGFGGIAPWIRDLESQDVYKVAKHIKNAGLKLSGYCRSPYIPSVTAEGFRKNIELNKRAIDDAIILGSPCFIFVVGSLPDGEKDLSNSRQQVIDGVGELLEYVKDKPIDLALEPLHPMYAGDRSCLNTLSQASDICQILEPNPTKNPKMTVALDLYHCWWDPDLNKNIDVLSKQNRISAFHICDWLVPTTDFLMDRGMMGDGVIQISNIRNNLESKGFDKMIEVEIFSNIWGVKPNDEILSTITERIKDC